MVVEDLVRLSGGASRETYAFTARGVGRPRRLVLRRDPPGTVSSGLALEGALLAAAAGEGVPVPAVVASGADPAELGAAFVVMEHVDGETIPRRILRDAGLEDARRGLAAQCGAALAAVHRIPPDAVPGLPAGDVLAQLTVLLDGLGQPHPALELGLRWLAAHRPAPFADAVVHGDFRLGNLMVDPSGLRAVLDWELAHRGDPLEDLGWLCVKAWRFGGSRPVGGFGTLDELVDSYEASCGRAVDRDALAWWQVYGTVRWGVICIVQAHTHLSGAVRSVELAAIGRRICEVEWDLLELLDSGRADLTDGEATSGDVAAGVGDAGAGDAAPTAGEGRAASGPGGWLPNDAPSATELLDAVHAFLTGEVVAGTDGRLRFHARVAANVVAMVAREIALGPRLEAAHRRRLTALGVRDDADLAAAVRSGAFDGRHTEIMDALRAAVADKLRVANPAHLPAPG